MSNKEQISVEAFHGRYAYFSSLLCGFSDALFKTSLKLGIIWLKNLTVMRCNSLGNEALYTSLLTNLLVLSALCLPFVWPMCLDMPFSGLCHEQVISAIQSWKAAPQGCSQLMNAQRKWFSVGWITSYVLCWDQPSAGLSPFLLQHEVPGSS